MEVNIAYWNKALSKSPVISRVPFKELSSEWGNKAQQRAWFTVCKCSHYSAAVLSWSTLSLLLLSNKFSLVSCHQSSVSSHGMPSSLTCRILGGLSLTQENRNWGEGEWHRKGKRKEKERPSATLKLLSGSCVGLLPRGTKGHYVNLRQEAVGGYCGTGVVGGKARSPVYWSAQSILPHPLHYSQAYQLSALRLSQPLQ